MILSSVVIIFLAGFLLHVSDSWDFYFSDFALLAFVWNLFLLPYLAIRPWGRPLHLPAFAAKRRFARLALILSIASATGVITLLTVLEALS
jgi:hypothetical protein